MADDIVARLRQHHFAHPFVHLVQHENDVWNFMELNSRRHPLTGRIVRMGGTPSGTAQARADSWRRMLAFVDEHLGDSPQSGRQ